MEVCAIDEAPPEWEPGDFILKAITREYLALESAFGSFVYVIQWGDKGPVKIGAAASPSQRLAQLQTANWNDLKLCAVVPVVECVFVEKAVHKMAAAHNIRAEWFDLGPSTAVGFILAAMKIGDFPIMPLKVAVKDVFNKSTTVTNNRGQEFIVGRA